MARFLVVGCLLTSAVAVAEDPKLSPRHVSVTGTAIARVQPDTVVWNVTIRRTDQDLATAQKACDEGVRKVLALRNELKLKSEDVQTGYLSVEKVYDRDRAGNITSFRHFEVVRTVTLRQHDTTQFDDVLARLVGAADIEVSHHLESSEYHKLRAQTRLEAVKAAREKAAAMTELLGAKLGRVLRIAEPRENWSSPGFASNMAFSAPRQAEPDEAPGTFAPGAIEVRVSIETDFEVE
ncbi:MAG TPA: SIMPL domain-containing protein [Pirellulaceae bacterium]|nr:SIMPL domain-containing protein [Pirellulaceae bacterium]